MITGHPQRPSRNNPVNAVLHKPFNLQGLRRAVSKLLQKTDDCVELNLAPRG